MYIYDNLITLSGIENQRIEILNGVFRPTQEIFSHLAKLNDKKE